MHAKGSDAYGIFTVTHDITSYTKAKIFSELGKKTELFTRFSTVAGERCAADAELDIRGFAIKFYTEEGNLDMVGNNTPVFFLVVSDNWIFPERCVILLIFWKNIMPMALVKFFVRTAEAKKS